jgi:glycosyltransferase involved in cell wall biosynthesis
MSLAQAMASYVETTFISFGPSRRSWTQSDLRVEIYPAICFKDGIDFDPISYRFLTELVGADIVHCHQYRTTVSNLSILTAATLGKGVFVTDLGGVANNFVDDLPLSTLVDAFLPMSSFSAKELSGARRVEIIYGGVDRWFLDDAAIGQRERRVLFVGRLMPHKGINYLLEAVDNSIALDIIGRPYNREYFEMLQRMATGRRVRFVTDASDSDLLQAYSQCLVTVLPSVYEDVYGSRYSKPELLGLVLLESMARGTPVICTNVGGMPEVVTDGVTGFVVPPNDPGALRDRINYLVSNPDVAEAMGRNGRRKVLEDFTWESVTQRCLAAYRLSS